MKKLFCVLLAAALCLGLAACGGPAASADYTVAIVQQMDHSSLDEIREAVMAGLTAYCDFSSAAERPSAAAHSSEKAYSPRWRSSRSAVTARR